jgi:penicillin-binding protein 2
LLRLKELLNISGENTNTKSSATPKRYQYRLVDKYERQEIAKFAVARPASGVDIQTHLIRHYPYYDLASTLSVM